MEHKNICARRATSTAGSVLVFAIVMLSILTVLGVAFLLLAQHAVASSRAGVTNTQSTVAAEAGLIRGTKFLNSSVKPGYTSTPDGVVKLDYSTNPLGELIITQSTTANAQGAGFNSTVGMFEHNLQFNAAHGTVVPTFALLSSRYADAAYPGAPYYSTAPMRLSATPPDRASVYYLRSDNTDFYSTPTKGSRKALSPSGTIRAKSYQWVRDLDANLSINPALWGIDTRNVPNAPSPAVLVGNILNTLRSNSDLLETLSDADIGYIASLPANTRFASVQAMAQGFPTYEAYTQGKITAEAYQFWRADIESYFTPFVDARHDVNGNFVLNSSGSLISQFKPAPAALNINTAPVEVIRALLSQIPDFDPRNPSAYVTFGSMGKDLLLAKRIVAKRPFLCRMEFEDFAASLLPGDTADLSSDAGLRTPLGMVNFAIQRRINTELRISQYLEIPGLYETLTPDKSSIYEKVYQNANTTQRMAERFAFFLDDTSGMVTSDTPKRNDCVISVKAFNNLLNAVSANPNASQQYVVSMVPGQKGAPYAAVLANADPTAFTKTDGIILGGDDTIDDKGVVTSGPNGIAETAVFGYSYYSFDAQSIEQMYKPVLHTKKDGTPLYDNIQLGDPSVVGKFVYGDPANFDDATPPKAFAPANPLYKNYGIKDLQRWSCVGDGKRSGYYEMCFNGNDQMLLELGEQSASDFPDEAEEVIVGIDITQKLRTCVTNPLVRDDVQESANGDPISAGDPIVLPGPNLKLETSVTILDKLTKLRKGDDRIVQAIRLAQLDSSTYDAWAAADTNGTTTDTFYLQAKDGYDYIIPGVGLNLLSTVQPQADPTDQDVLVSIIVDGGNETVETSVPDDVLNALGDAIQIGPNFINDSFVWGPMRASQRLLDQQLAVNGDEIPSAARTSGNGTGDVAWGPPIAFRSRFFTVYVLAQGLNTHPAVLGTVTSSAQPGSNGPLAFSYTSSDPSNPGISAGSIAPGSLIAVASSVPSRKNVYVVDTVVINGANATITLATPLVESFSGPATTAVYSYSVLGERRIESAYDAFNDEVLSRHSPLTDKRSLGDP